MTIIQNLRDAWRDARGPGRLPVKTLLVSLFAGLIALATPASAQTPIGQAVSVDPAATAQLGNAQTVILHGADLYLGQLISTGEGGQVQIVFSDETRMVVGPNSQLLLEDYLLRNDNTVASFTVDALSGTFRFITGDSDKDAYQINTPSGTIGVRGTTFDLFVDAIKELGLVWLLDGGVQLCDFEENCVELTEICDFGAIPVDIDPTVFDPEDGEFEFDPEDDFPYVISQLPLRQDFRIAVARFCAREHDFNQFPTIPSEASDSVHRDPREDDYYCEGEGGYYDEEI